MSFLMYFRGKEFRKDFKDLSSLKAYFPPVPTLALTATAPPHLAEKLKKSLMLSTGVQGWRSGESTRLPPMWPGFDSQIRSQMWVEFVGSLLCTERFSPGTPVSPLLKNQHLT